MDALTGERLAAAARTIEVDGAGVGRKPPRLRRALGLLSAREERLGHASVPAMTLWENGVLTAEARQHLSRRGLLDKARARNFAARIVADFAVSSAGVDGSAERLSGATCKNSWSDARSYKPGRAGGGAADVGVDVGAAATIHARLLALANAGTAILIISQDLDELFAVAGSYRRHRQRSPVTGRTGQSHHRRRPGPQHGRAQQ